MDTPAEAAAKLLRVASIFEGQGLVEIGHAVGKGARVEANRVASDVAGGDMRLSHWGRKGVKLGMGYDLEAGGRQVVVKLRPPGVWVAEEKGAAPHLIGRGRGRRARSGGRVRYLHGGSYAHPVRAPVAHPGMGGKGAIRRTFGRIRGRASDDAHKSVVKQLGSIYG